MIKYIILFFTYDDIISIIIFYFKKCKLFILSNIIILDASSIFI